MQSMEQVRETKDKFHAEKISHHGDFQETKSSFTYLRNLKLVRSIFHGDCLARGIYGRYLMVACVAAI
eukprot:COSAG01_NODE_2254_length_8070_cov_6.783743_9_plen_68_part_00